MYYDTKIIIIYKMSNKIYIIFKIIWDLTEGKMIKGSLSAHRRQGDK